MALIKCNNCGADISDKAQNCPQCGSQVVVDSQRLSTLQKCVECGNEIPEGVSVCPKCGCPVDERITSNPKRILDKARNIPTKTKRIIALALVLIIIVGGALIISQNVLFGDDKIAYDLIMNVADNFKNPSSVRLTSGIVGVDKDCLFCGISATNGLGARSTSYYYIDKEGWILEGESDLSLYKTTGKLNISKINKKLSKALSGKYY